MFFPAKSVWPILSHDTSTNYQADVEIHSNHRRDLPVLKTTKGGSIVLILPNRLFQTDLTIHMDVKANPGPEIHRNGNVSAQSSVLHNSSNNYSRNQLLNMKAISNDLYLTLKDNGILRTRGIRSGISQRLKHQQITAFQRSEKITNVPQHSWKGVNLNNLSYVKRGQEQHPHGFDVPGNFYLSEGTNLIPVHITARTIRPTYLRSRFLGNLTKVDIQRQQENRISAFNKIKFALWNAQSLQKKSGLVCDIISSNRLDIFAITETWLNNEGNNISLAEILNTLKDFKKSSKSQEKMRKVPV